MEIVSNLFEALEQGHRDQIPYLAAQQEMQSDLSIEVFKYHLHSCQSFGHDLHRAEGCWDGGESVFTDARGGVRRKATPHSESRLEY